MYWVAHIDERSTIAHLKNGADSVSGTLWRLCDVVFTAVFERGAWVDRGGVECYNFLRLFLCRAFFAQNLFFGVKGHSEAEIGRTYGQGTANLRTRNKKQGIRNKKE